MKNNKTKQIAIAYAVICGSIILVFLYFAVVDPRVLVLKVKENNPIENLSFISFALAFLIGIYQVIRLKNKNYKFAYLFIPLTSLVLFMEEIGYGGRFFPMKYPRLHKLKFDGLHDVGHVLAHSFKRGEYPEVIERVSSSLFLAEYFYVFPVIALLVGFIILKRIADQGSRKRAAIQGFLALAGITSLIGLVNMFTIPSFSQSAGVIGLSPTRLLLVLTFGLILIGVVYYIMKFRKDQAAADRAANLIDANIIQKPITRVSLILTLLSVYFVSWIIFFLLPLEVDPIVHIRVSIIVLWLGAASFLGASALFHWQPSYASLVQALRFGLQNLTGYRYIILAVLYIFVAQVYDINVWAYKFTVNPEEYLELLAAFSFVFAAVSIQDPELAG